jgi:hypothetical protein
MNYRIGKPLLLSIVLALLLVACANSATPEAVDEPEATIEPAGEATATAAPTNIPAPTATPVSTAASETALDAVARAATIEALVVPPDFVLNELASYQAESFGLSFDYPAGWSVIEDPDAGIQIESKAGIGERLMTDFGVSVVIIPLAADALPGETPVQKLASYIVGSRTSPTTALGEPLEATVNGQDLAFSSFVDKDNGLEGVYAVFLVGDEVVVVSALAGGENRVSYRPGVETIVNSLVLAQGE